MIVSDGTRSVTSAAATLTVINSTPPTATMLGELAAEEGAQVLDWKLAHDGLTVAGGAAGVSAASVGKGAVSARARLNASGERGSDTKSSESVRRDCTASPAMVMRTIRTRN